MQVDPNCGSLGMFVNLSAVMLRLCKNFLDKDVTKRSEIDGTYVFCNSHLDMSGLTTLHASSKEVAGWTDKLQNIGGFNLMSNSCEETTSSGSNTCGKTRYTFGCEFFFMTARVLHLGLIKSLSKLQRLHR
ncbi:hypothetical protein MKW94_028618, partial [Papaver nudicaule]|nr:hypothetical protein [Papaver nudicaule]